MTVPGNLCMESPRSSFGEPLKWDRV